MKRLSQIMALLIASLLWLVLTSPRSEAATPPAWAAAAPATSLVSCSSFRFAGPFLYDMGSGLRDVTLADFNNDGRLDVVASSTLGNQVAVRLGSRGGNFGAVSFYTVGTQPSQLFVGIV